MVSALAWLLYKHAWRTYNLIAYTNMHGEQRKAPQSCLRVSQWLKLLKITHD
jgi:hypothetical protein